jgi:hypothetical protein
MNLILGRHAVVDHVDCTDMLMVFWICSLLQFRRRTACTRARGACEGVERGTITGVRTVAVDEV